MKSNPTDIRGQFRTGELTKYEYSERMHAAHAVLFDYGELIRGSEVGNIQITPGGVCIETGNGVKFALSRTDYYIPPAQLLNFGDYEASEREIIYRLLSPGMVVFDVGANIGWYSLSIAKKLPDCRILAFEPIPATFGELQRNVEVNGFGNVAIFNHGLSDHEGEVTFYFAQESSGAASAANILGSGSVREVTCKVRRLDDVWAESNLHVDFIKCDVEGAELLVFQGGMKCIGSDRPMILCEMLRKWSAKFHYHPNDIIKLLGAIGYKCFACRAGRLVEFCSMDEETVETNFVFLHPETHAEKIEAAVS